MSRAREAGQQLAASYYGFDGFPEFMFVFFFFGPFSEARLTGSFREVLFGSAFFLGSGPFSALSATSISSTLGVSHFRSPPPGPGNPPGKVNAVVRTDVRITPAY